MSFFRRILHVAWLVSVPALAFLAIGILGFAVGTFYRSFDLDGTYLVDSTGVKHPPVNYIIETGSGWIEVVWSDGAAGETPCAHFNLDNPGPALQRASGSNDLHFERLEYDTFYWDGKVFQFFRYGNTMGKQIILDVNLFAVAIVVFCALILVRPLRYPWRRRKYRGFPIR